MTCADDTKKQMVVDMTAADALVLRSGKSVTITKIHFAGRVASGKNGTLVVRKNSVSGPIVFVLGVDNTNGLTEMIIDKDSDFEALSSVAATGLYLDALADAWMSGSKAIFYATKGF